MATITTKYSVGDVVYYATTIATRKQHPCPDCLGSRKWKAQSPAGAEFEFDCPRCSTRFQANSDLSLSYTAHVGHVEKLTIGQVRAQVGGDREETEYMCHETGIGGGSVYRESMLFTSAEDAQKAADAIAATTDKSVEWIAKQYDKTLDLSDYQMKDAAEKGSDDRESLLKVRRDILIEDIREAQDMHEIKAALESFDRREAA